MLITTPTVGGSSGTWGSELNSALTVVDNHDHAAGNGKRINTDAILIDADLTMGGFGLTNIDRAAFAAITALVSGQRVLFVSSSDNELYWRSQAGVNVKITDGASLNVAAFVGGIGGDYTAVSAALNYDDANARYTLRGAGGTPWARLAAGELRTYETGTTETVYVGFAAPSALAASYTVTMPTALPGSTVLMQVSSAGQVSFSNTVAGAATFSTSITTPTIGGTPNFTGAVTMASTVTALDFKHTGIQSVTLPASLALDRLGTHTKATGGTSGATNRYTIAASANPLVWPIVLKENDRIVGYSVWLDKNTEGANTVSARMYRTDGTDGTETPLGAGSSSSADEPGFIGLTENGLVIDVTEDNQYYLVFTPGSGVAPAADELYHATIAFTRPA